MRLTDELRAVGCPLDARTFEDVLESTYVGMQRGGTVDAFLCRPWDVRDYCAAVRGRAGLDDTCDEMIMRRLLNMRKRGLFAAGGCAGRRTLAAELVEVGTLKAAADFRDAAVQAFIDVYRGFTVDRLLMQWRDALHYCALVRWEVELPDTPPVNNLILRTLLNTRRGGELAVGGRKPDAAPGPPPQPGDPS